LALQSILGELRSQVLRGCVILFSGILPLNGALGGTGVGVGVNVGNQNEWVRYAEMYGAVCVNEFQPGVTHVVANKAGTQKVHQATTINRVYIVSKMW
jgi:hypothetical protein